MFRYFISVVPGGDAPGVGAVVLASELALMCYAVWRFVRSWVRRVLKQETPMAVELSTSRTGSNASSSHALSVPLLHFE
jgi:hypothetical protein